MSKIYKTWNQEMIASVTNIDTEMLFVQKIVQLSEKHFCCHVVDDFCNSLIVLAEGGLTEGKYFGVDEVQFVMASKYIESNWNAIVFRGKQAIN